MVVDHALEVSAVLARDPIDLRLLLGALIYCTDSPTFRRHLMDAAVFLLAGGVEYLVRRSPGGR